MILEWEPIFTYLERSWSYEPLELLQSSDAIQLFKACHGVQNLFPCQTDKSLITYEMNIRQSKGGAYDA